MRRRARVIAFSGFPRDRLIVASSAPANATKLDLSTMTCKQFLESGDDTIELVLTWMDGWYKGDEDNAIIEIDVFVDNAKKFGTYCGSKPDGQHRRRRRRGAGQVSAKA
jgi:acid stress chaperone HdeB